MRVCTLTHVPGFIENDRVALVLGRFEREANALASLRCFSAS